ncbi:hypothetical protein HYH03_009486 [Edaphochlamys debaryana]|uniref:Translin-associated factor X-interacting protein 1 N-terminal domain-containing protein n=1 Tax=Edaphochlamys debaryana TaxID=47281 RepID=A0A835XW70_9CHLO|nr:hypothetical protein HYH03_009486 [Edaphochlamys debaryana]|eukprot:KAG2492242.1 hypothetical protein HYH03_009486 [Edaphochlamys debaryana]
MAPFAGSGAKSGKASDLAAAVAAAQTATFEVRSWSLQAKEITSDLASSDKYKSLALHAEVKLAEALERCERVSPLATAPTGEERPNKLRTAVACQLLGEFAELCGPFAGVLATLRDELLKAIYSWHYASERGGLAFDQLPWFSVSERLEREKEALVEEREAFKGAMAEQQEAVGRIEEQMGVFRRATEAAQLEAAALRTHLDRITINEEQARLEAKTGREELKKLRKEFLKQRDELEAERAAHKALQAKYVELNEYSARTIDQLSAAASSAEAEAADMRRLADSRMPPEKFERLVSDLAGAQAELEAAQGYNKDLEAVNSKLAHRLDIMTPRPVWRKLADHGLTGGRRTAELVHRVEEKLGRYATELDDLKQRLQLAAALLQPDPAPREVQLTLVTEASPYFLTEGGDPGAPGAPGAPASTAEPCGLAASVPRCLRWSQRVPLAAHSMEQTEALVMAVWKAQQAMDASATVGTLQSFLYYYFNPQGLATEETAKHAYSLYAACAAHAKTSPVVRTFWLVLTGQVSEAAVCDQRAMVSGFSALLHSLPPAGVAGAGAAVEPGAPGEEGGEAERPRSASTGAQQDEASTSGAAPAAGDWTKTRLRVADVASALERLFPNRPPFRVNKLREALSSQFPGETLSLAALSGALEPHGLLPPPPSSAPSTAKAARFNPDLLARPTQVQGPLVSLLLGQHVDEIQNLCLEVATQLSDVQIVEPPAGQPAGDSPAELSAVLEKLGGLLGPGRAAAAVLSALGLVPGGHAGGGGGEEEDEEGGGAGPGDVVMPAGMVVDAGDLTQRLLQRCLLKPLANYDVSGAVAWAREAHGAAAGA